MNEKTMPFRVAYNRVLFNDEAPKRKNAFKETNAAKQRIIS
jgi:hypothetical protein